MGDCGSAAVVDCAVRPALLLLPSSSLRDMKRLPGASGTRSAAALSTNAVEVDSR